MAKHVWVCRSCCSFEALHFLFPLFPIKVRVCFVPEKERKGFKEKETGKLGVEKILWREGLRILVLFINVSFKKNRLFYYCVQARLGDFSFPIKLHCFLYSLSSILSLLCVYFTLSASLFHIVYHIPSQIKFIFAALRNWKSCSVAVNEKKKRERILVICGKQNIEFRFPQYSQ